MYRHLPREGGVHEDAGHQGLVAAVPAGPVASCGSQTMMSSPDRSFGGRRILVTGGAGFVGGVLTQKLVAAGARVTVLDDLFTGKAETIPTGAEFVHGSVTDQALVDDLVAANSLI